MSMEAVHAAGNTTLGFSSIQFINLKSRFDRMDSATIQAYLSGIDIQEQAAIEPHDMNENEVGLPPADIDSQLKPGEKGCWRSHANIWSDLLKTKEANAVLIIESDAGWDVHVRDIMSNMNPHFTTFLNDIQSEPLNDPSYEGRKATKKSEPSDILPNPKDPWHSKHWDVLGLGSCHEWDSGENRHAVFPDAQVEEGKTYYDNDLGRNRIIRESSGFICTTAYAISKTGAAKLLTRSAINLNSPIDLLMAGMAGEGQLKMYNIVPTVFGQWAYKKGLGMEQRGSNSDVNGNNEEDLTKMDYPGWDEAHLSHSVWEFKEGHDDYAFRDWGLERAWELIIGK